jgi:hypothetical protein
MGRLWKIDIPIPSLNYDTPSQTIIQNLTAKKKMK